MAAKASNSLRPHYVYSCYVHRAMFLSVMGSHYRLHASTVITITSDLIDLDETWQMDCRPGLSDHVEFSVELLQWFRLAASISV